LKLYDINNIFIKETEFLPYNFTGIVEYLSGIKQWRLNGKVHRVDGPAIIYPKGTKDWYVNGKLHRVDGPAIEWFNGWKVWFVYGNEVTEEQCKLLHDIMKLKGLL